MDCPLYHAKFSCESNNLAIVTGAREKTRTSTTVKSLVPETSASTIPPPGQVSIAADIRAPPPCQRRAPRRFHTGLLTWRAVLMRQQAHEKQRNRCAHRAPVLAAKAAARRQPRLEGGASLRPAERGLDASPPQAGPAGRRPRPAIRGTAALHAARFRAIAGRAGAGRLPSKWIPLQMATESPAFPRPTMPSLRSAAAARERILILDGAMGTQIQGLGLGEDDFRGHAPSRLRPPPAGQQRPPDPDPAARRSRRSTTATPSPAPTSSRPTPSPPPRSPRPTTACRRWSTS